MSVIKHFFILIPLILCEIVYAETKHPLQKSEVLIDFYKSEYQTWQEYLDRVGTVETDPNIDILFYHLKIEVNTETPFVSGSVLCSIKITAESIESIRLNLHHSFSIDSITGDNSDFIFSNDLIQIELDKIYNIGDTVEIEIFYQGIPVLAGGYKGLRYEWNSNNEPVIASLSTPFLAHYWWPCKDGPGDKSDSVYIDITIPAVTIDNIPLIAVSNGVLENIHSENGKITYQWRHRYPIVPYYVMIAISNYVKYHQLYEDNSGEIFPLDYYVFNEHLAEAMEGVAQLPEVLSFYSDLFGPYPFKNEKYGMTQLGFYGAIENQTNTIINNMSLAWFEVSIHELAHMWFGDMITCKDWHDAWLNEGFATYCEALWAEYTYGNTAYKMNMQANEYFNGGTLYLYDSSDPFQIFISIIYRKGAFVLHMLRGVLSDQVFFDCLKQYATHPSFMYGEATTEDFIEICEDISGQDLSYFFDQWIYDEYFPIYNYGYYQDPKTMEATLKIDQVQTNLNHRPIFKMPVQLQFIFTGGRDSTITIWNDMEAQTYRFVLSNYLDSLIFDPENYILDQNFYSDSITQSIRKEVPDYFELYQNYPNPFNTSTRIEFILSKSRNVRITVYNILGEELFVLLNGRREVGKHYVTLNASTLSSGVYFCVLQSEKLFKKMKMVLIK